MELQLAGAHRATYNDIFHHPVTRNLKWRDVRSMFEAMGDVVEEPNGNLKVARNGQTVVLRPPDSGGDGDTEVGELMKIREFIGRSATPPPG